MTLVIWEILSFIDNFIGGIVMVDFRKVYLVDEDRWVTIKGTHVLVSDRGDIKNKNLKKKISDKKDSKE